MDWVTALWSAVAGACLLLALMHFVIWCRDRKSWANLWFAISACAVTSVMGSEIITMHTDNPRVFEQVVQWTHVIYLLVSFGMMGFVHSYFGTGRRWLLGTALGLRVAAVVANFVTGSSLHFIAIHSLKKMTFLGESVTIVSEWDANPWVRLGQGASLVWLIYVVDASWRLWRVADQDGKRRAVLVGGSLVFFILLAAAVPGLVSAGMLEIPMNVSFPFFFIILAMNYELSGDVLRTARLSLELKTSRERLALAAAAARMALWEWDLASGRVWISDEGRAIYGVPSKGDLDLEQFMMVLHPDDQAPVSRKMDEALKGSGQYSAEYRVVLPDGKTRWLAATGRIERDTNGRPILMRGVSVDFTKRKLSANQMELQRQELAHLSRVSMLGEMASALAHELNQPLAAMLSNSQVGRQSLKLAEPDLVEMGEILEDITADAKRAGGIIHGMRAMIKRDTTAETELLDLTAVANQVIALMNSQIQSRRVKLHLQLDDRLPPVCAGHVEIQQVLINLVMNGLDAMNSVSREGVLKIISSHQDGNVIVTVHDSGPGVPPEILPRLFDPFFSTKSSGLGLGLSISRSIVERFDGELLAENSADGGAVFQMTLPAASLTKRPNQADPLTGASA